MFVQYSFVGHTRKLSRPDRLPFQMNESLISLVGVTCMILTASAYILA